MFPGHGMILPTRGLQLGFPRNINWAGILTTAGKTLNVVNQAIPVFYQIGPIYKNVKTMFKVANEFRKPETAQETTDKSLETTEVKEEKILRNPVFFK